MFFDRFTRQVEIHGALRCVTALRVGVGRGSNEVSATDLPVLKDAMDRPLIPGSSLKGVLRSLVESVLRAIPEREVDAVRWACDPFVAPCVDPRDDPQETERMKLKERVEHKRAKMKGLCRACRTFGAQGLASHVIFRDARARGPVHVERRDGVAIDRDLGRVSGARKYDFEVVAEGSRFDFGVAIDSADPWQEGAIVLGLDLLAEGFARVGGATSRGLGLVALDDLQVKVLDRERVLAGLSAGLVPWQDFRRKSLDAWQRYVASGGEG
jgi:CRISPR-associated protein Csm3